MLSKIDIANTMKNAITVDIATNGARGIVKQIVKLVIKVAKNHFRAVCRSSEGSKYESSHNSRKRSDTAKGKCAHRCSVYEICRDECHDDDKSVLGDLTDQVQSLFYNWELNLGVIEVHTNLEAIKLHTDIIWTELEICNLIECQMNH